MYCRQFENYTLQPHFCKSRKYYELLQSLYDTWRATATASVGFGHRGMFALATWINHTHKLIHTTHHPYPLHGGPWCFPFLKLSHSGSTHRLFLVRKQSSQFPSLRIFRFLPLTIRSRSDGHNRIRTLALQSATKSGAGVPDVQVRNVPQCRVGLILFLSPCLLCFTSLPLELIGLCCGSLLERRIVFHVE